MNFHFNGNQHNDNIPTVATQARLLMRAQRQRVQQRQQTMLNRAAEELGIDA
jgi:hypothetical protein